MDVPKVIKDWFTENDGVSWCLGRAIGFAAFCEMGYKFITTPDVNWVSFAGGVSAIIAAIAAKNYSEKKNEPAHV